MSIRLLSSIDLSQLNLCSKYSKENSICLCAIQSKVCAMLKIRMCRTLHQHFWIFSKFWHPIFSCGWKSNAFRWILSMCITYFCGFWLYLSFVFSTSPFLVVICFSTYILVAMKFSGLICAADMMCVVVVPITLFADAHNRLFSLIFYLNCLPAAATAASDDVVLHRLTCYLFTKRRMPTHPIRPNQTKKKNVETKPFGFIHSLRLRLRAQSESIE